MKESIADLRFPFQGLDVSKAYDAQPPGTTPSAVNVRGYDPRNGRDRGGQRAGQSKYLSSQINASNVIQCITHCVYSAAGSTLANRVLRPMAIAGGTIKRFTSSATAAVTNGSAAFSSTAKPIWAAQMLDMVFFADGAAYKYYDAPTDSILAITASSGSLPTDSGGNKPRLVTCWRNRLVYSGLPVDPKNWFMSAMADETNWNYAPSPDVETKAVAGNNSNAGYAPDDIHCLIPYNDEILIFGCDHTIWQLNGDPASADGQINFVAEVGMAWGQPYCRDGDGRLYFMSNDASIYRFTVGGIPERISDPIAELLMVANLGTYVCRMAYDERQNGFHVWITAVAAAGATTHYYYDTRQAAWWKDTYGNNDLNPIAVHVLDGDAASDRVILLGGWDGYIRQIAPTATDDDGTAITSSVYIGPIKAPSGGGLYVADLQCGLEASSDTVTWTLYTGDSPETAYNASSAATGTFTAGRNRSPAVRSFGHAHYVKLAGPGAVGDIWGMEYLRARLRQPDGTGRQRIY